MNKKVLLINPSQFQSYTNVKIKGGAIYSPSLTLAVLAAPLVKAGHNVRILDLNKEPDLDSVLKTFSPDFVGITFTTLLFEEARRICRMIKSYSKDIIIISGGAHSTALPTETLKELDIDIAVIGEGDFSLLKIINGENTDTIPGITCKKDGEIKINPCGDYIEDLDSLPLPAWDLINISQYKTTPLLSRASPAGWIETSRGCPYTCGYCTKNIFGTKFRFKSVNRVIEEIEHMLKLGFKELHIADDNFTMDTARAKQICEEILRRNLKFPWATVTGIRIDRVDKELLELMYKAGCYRVYFGIESGDQTILNKIKKGISLNKIREVVEMSKNTGLEVFGFFMAALPGETEDSIKKTIAFAKSLPLDMAKMSITVPLPGTALFKELDKGGFIKTYDWSKYNLYVPARDVYQHPTVSWDIVEKYFNRFYREFYFRPGYMLNFAKKNLIRKDFFSMVKILLETKW
ncbi:MAG: radical SAM protein [bacterium]|nr:radical SAM protein [bacterium]